MRRSGGVIPVRMYTALGTVVKACPLSLLPEPDNEVFVRRILAPSGKPLAMVANRREQWTID